MGNNNFDISIWWPEFVSNMRSDGLSNQEIQNFLMKMYLEKDMSFEQIQKLAQSANLEINREQFEKNREIYISGGRGKIIRSSFDSSGNIILNK